MGCIVTTEESEYASVSSMKYREDLNNGYVYCIPPNNRRMNTGFLKMEVIFLSI